MASAAALTLPRLEDVERGPHIRGEAAYDPVQDIGAQPPGRKEKSREDEEWLENPAHPRNWPSAKKWINMAIVSRPFPDPSWFPAASYSRNFRFHPTRFCLRSQVR